VLAALVFLATLVAHSLSRNRTSYDSKWSVHTALSIFWEGDTDLDEYRDLVLQGPRYLYEFVDGHVYGVYPIGTAAFAAPAVFLLDRALPVVLRTFPALQHRLEGRRNDPATGITVLSIHDGVEVLVASLVVALTALLVYCIALRELDRWRAALLALVFAFCTPAWSTASRALWQHGPSMLMLSAALLLIIRARERPGLVQFASIPLAYAFVIRPTNAVFIAALSIYVFVRYRSRFLSYAAWSLVVVVPFVAYNLAVYHSVLSPYYFQRAISSRHFLEGLAGTLVSPSRGLFVFAPVLLLSVWGAVLRLRTPNGDRLLDTLLSCVLVGHWLVISSFPVWYGGHSVGPRYFTDIIPAFVYFLIPVLRRLAEGPRVRRLALAASFAVLAAVSFLVNLSGAVNCGALAWNGRPVNVDDDPGRVWDWSDPQFLRGITRR